MEITNTTSSLSARSSVNPSNLSARSSVNQSGLTAADLSFITKPTVTPTPVIPKNIDFTIPVSASIAFVDPSTLSSDGFELQDQAIIPNTFLSSSFTPGDNFIEFYVYDAQKNLLTSNYWE